MSLSSDISAVISQLDAIGFDYGQTHVSVWRALQAIGTGLLVFIAGMLASKGVRFLFRRSSRLDATGRVVGEKLLSVLVWALAVLIGADMIGLDLTAFALFSGAFGLAIGFGLQKTFGNLLAGIILLLDRSIKPGDVIAVGEGARRTVGQVNRVGVRAVSVITRDRVEFLIPNDTLMSATVENWSYSSRDVRIKIPVKVDNSSDIAFVEKLLLEEACKNARVLTKPEPQAWLSGFDENAIHFEIQVWIVDPEDGLGNLQSDILKGVWQSFMKNGVKLPFPQHDIAIKEWPGDPSGKKLS